MWTSLGMECDGWLSSLSSHPLSGPILPLRLWASFQASAQQRLQNDQTTRDDLFPSPILSVNLFTYIFLLFAKFQLMLSLFTMTQEIHHTSLRLQRTSLSDSNRFIISTSVFGNERKDSNPSFKERFSSTVNNVKPLEKTGITSSCRTS